MNTFKHIRNSAGRIGAGRIGAGRIGAGGIGAGGTAATGPGRHALPGSAARWSICLVAFVATLVSLGIAPRLHAQRRAYVPPAPVVDSSKFLIFPNVYAGPYFTGGFSRQSDQIPDGWHTGSRFAYMFGLTSDFWISPWLGFDLSLLYDSRDFYLATDHGDSDNIDGNIGYISIQPSVRIAWLLLGIIFDLPMAGNADESVAEFHAADGAVRPVKANLNIGSESLQTVVSLHAALSVPVLASENGSLHIIASADWPLSGTLRSTSFDTTGHFPTAGAGKLPTLEAGLSYQFDLLH